jgi:hypothetical protein
MPSCHQIRQQIRPHSEKASLRIEDKYQATRIYRKEPKWWTQRSSLMNS